MYLSSEQHDRLQTIVTGFEIPYRTYVSCEVLKKFPTESSFVLDVANRPKMPTHIPNYQMINSMLGQMKIQPKRYYNLLVNAHKAKDLKILKEEIDVPDISVIITFTIVYKELFTDFLLNFKDEETYLTQALKYKYVRNKVDHRGCKTLEIPDMTITLDFISNCFIQLNYDEALFWDKSSADISREVQALQTSSLKIPFEIHNIQDMPFPDMKIVCRDKEIEELKEFVYGKPMALRKQASCILYGYGGVGKTALVLESLKQIIKDIQDKKTINNYNPHFVLFFTAKEEFLDFSKTNGKIQNVSNRYSFKSSSDLINNIYHYLGISSFSGYDKEGLIIIDNLETLSPEERKRVEDFVRFESPQQIQYIITSRNEENYECRKIISGFNDSVSGKDFISTYIEENGFELELTDGDIDMLLKIAMGNTLVLVLCLRRLSLKITSISEIANDIPISARVKKLEKEVTQIPANGFNIISEFMFKNSFLEILELYKTDETLISSILKIFAVHSLEKIDLYTISMLSKKPYSIIDPVLDLLCKYLIIEKTGETYRLNQFAEKYIIQLFMPDTETYHKIENEITNSTRNIQNELRKLEGDIERSQSLKQIIHDWSIISDGDRIAAAKAYRLYGDVKRDCNTMSSYHISSALNDAIDTIAEIERNTMHPYIKYQKARILQLIKDAEVIEYNFTEEIIKAYNETIWAIKVNPIYMSIKGTKSYASVLWKYGIELQKIKDLNHLQSAARYLEESKTAFEQLNKCDKLYCQCSILLAYVYLDLYLLDTKVNIQYLRKARAIANLLLNNKEKYYGRIKSDMYSLREKLLQYGSF